MSENFKWGIIGPGNIARKFASAVEKVDDSIVSAVASRSQERAEQFGDDFGVPHRYGSYEQMAHEGDIDAIYIASPHSEHLGHIQLALNAGRPCLCEKPMTVNATQARMAADLAREKNLFLMEAMWTRFLPAIQTLRSHIDRGAIDEVRMVVADFGFRTQPDPEHRLFDPNRAGGALLDVGVYPISFAHFIFGEKPEEICSHANIGEFGVDEENAMALRFSGGRMALLSSAIRLKTPHVAHIVGTDGEFRIHSFWKAQEFQALRPNASDTVRRPFGDNGFEFQIEEAQRCIREGNIESETMPLDESIAIIETMDRVRDQWGLKFPCE